MVNTCGSVFKKDSTIQQLLHIVNLIRKSWTKGCITHGIFLDFSAAFDKCWNKSIIAKLKQIEVEGSCWDLFTSNLANRKQCTVVSMQKKWNDTCCFVSGTDPAETAVVLNRDLVKLAENGKLHLIQMWFCQADEWMDGPTDGRFIYMYSVSSRKRQLLVS